MDQQNIIKVETLKLEFDDGTAFDFNDINFARGKVTGIIGANGSGKTTLVEAILGLKKPKESKIWINGIDQKQFFNSVEHRLGLGSQLQIFAFSELVKVREMVALHKALYKKQSQKIYDDLAIGEISGKRLDKLSGGQKQRVNLYMALAHMPQLITLDEPSAALDKAMAEKLINLLKYLVDEQNCSILLITHHPYELDICDEILTILGGTKGYHVNRAQFIETIIGKFHGQIFIPEGQDAKAIETKISHLKHVKSHLRKHDQIDIYGDDGLEADFLTLIKNFDLNSYSFAQTNSADILKISTQIAG